MKQDMVLEDVTELYVYPKNEIAVAVAVLMNLGVCSDYSGSNTKLPKILLNGNNICMVRCPRVLFGRRGC